MADKDGRQIAESLIDSSKNLSMWARMTRKNALKLGGFDPELKGQLEELADSMDAIDAMVLDALAKGLKA